MKFPEWVAQGRRCYYKSDQCFEDDTYDEFNLYEITDVIFKKSGQADRIILKPLTEQTCCCSVKIQDFLTTIKPYLVKSSAQTYNSHLEYVLISPDDVNSKHSQTVLRGNKEVVTYHSNDVVLVQLDDGRQGIFQICEFQRWKDGVYVSGRWFYTAKEIADLTCRQEVTDAFRVYPCIDHQDILPLRCLLEHLSVKPKHCFVSGTDNYYYDVSENLVFLERFLYPFVAAISQCPTF